MKMQIDSDDLLDTVRAIKDVGHNEGELSLKDDRWLIMSQGPANVLMGAVMVPRDAMETYDRNGYERVGLNLNTIEEFVKRSNSDLVNLWMEKRTLHMEENDGNVHVEIATIDIDSVNGRVSETLNVEHEVKFRLDFSFVEDFYSKAENIIDSDFYMMGCRENGLYMYSYHDNGRIDDFTTWDSFEDVEIDWSTNNYSGYGHKPADDHAADVIYAIDFTKELHKPTDNPHISIGNHIPIRLLYELDSGVKISYFQTPRLPKSDDAISTIPDRIIEKHM